VRAALGAAALVALLVLAPVAAATTAAESATQHEIEGEVMCPICGTLLELAESPQAQREKVFVAGLIARGRDRAEVRKALVAQYGDEVLALPQRSGFSLSAYLVPIVAFLVAVLALGLGVLRWRRAAARSQPPPQQPQGPSEEDAARLEADLARYDL
jgi:cytochrome c-type biogenesis protein CcmH